MRDDGSHCIAQLLINIITVVAYARLASSMSLGALPVAVRCLEQLVLLYRVSKKITTFSNFQDPLIMAELHANPIM